MYFFKQMTGWNSNKRLDGIQNFWWKRFRPAQKQLRKASEGIRDDNRLIQHGGH